MTSRPVSDDEFYIGYGGRMPPGIRRRVGAAVIAFGCAAAGVITTVVLASTRLPPARFEFGIITAMNGVLRREPYPVLDTGEQRVWLVGTGKSGAERMLAGVADGPVMVRGSRIQRGRHEMLEVASAESGTVGVRSNPNHEIHEIPERASVTLRGEIVDSKCFLGVMNPAEGAVHRDCARRCLSGGLPPMLLIRDADGREELVLLVSSDGRAIGTAMAPAAGTPVDVTGSLRRDRKDFVLYVSAWTRRGR